jgi:hypothetical protein
MWPNTPPTTAPLTHPAANAGDAIAGARTRVVPRIKANFTTRLHSGPYVTTPGSMRSTAVSTDPLSFGRRRLISFRAGMDKFGPDAKSGQAVAAQVVAAQNRTVPATGGPATAGKRISDHSATGAADTDDREIFRAAFAVHSRQLRSVRPRNSSPVDFQFGRERHSSVIAELQCRRPSNELGHADPSMESDATMCGKYGWARAGGRHAAAGENTGRGGQPRG